VALGRYCLLPSPHPINGRPARSSTSRRSSSSHNYVLPSLKKEKSTGRSAWFLPTQVAHRQSLEPWTQTGVGGHRPRLYPMLQFCSTWLKLDRIIESLTWNSWNDAVSLPAGAMSTGMPCLPKAAIVIVAYKLDPHARSVVCGSRDTRPSNGTIWVKGRG
jgi:hypothetical protein